MGVGVGSQLPLLHGVAGAGPEGGDGSALQPRGGRPCEALVTWAALHNAAWLSLSLCFLPFHLSTRIRKREGLQQFCCHQLCTPQIKVNLKATPLSQVAKGICPFLYHRLLLLGPRELQFCPCSWLAVWELPFSGYDSR